MQPISLVWRGSLSPLYRTLNISDTPVYTYKMYVVLLTQHLVSGRATDSFHCSSHARNTPYLMYKHVFLFVPIIATKFAVLLYV